MSTFIAPRIGTWCAGKAVYLVSHRRYRRYDDTTVNFRFVRPFGEILTRKWRRQDFEGGPISNCLLTNCLDQLWIKNEQLAALLFHSSPLLFLELNRSESRGKMKSTNESRSDEMCFFLFEEAEINLPCLGKQVLISERCHRVVHCVIYVQLQKFQTFNSILCFTFFAIKKVNCYRNKIFKVFYAKLYKG